MDFRPNEMISAHKSLFSADPRLLDDHLHSQMGSQVVRDARSPTNDQLMGLAKKVYDGRSKREQFLNADLFGEPGWNMLIALYIAEAGGPRMTISSLCAASQCPDTTALRWIDRLVQLGLIEKVKSSLDGRIFFVGLQPSARTALNDYLCNLWKGLFAPS